VNIMPTALAAGALALACFLSPPAGAMPAGATPPNDGSNGVFGASILPSDVAVSLHNVTLTIAWPVDA
jgi:hypothetical protein